MRQSDGGARREPAINMPTSLLVAIAVLFAVHAVRSWLDDEIAVRLLAELAFIPASWTVTFGYGTIEEVVAAIAREAADPQTVPLRVAWARFALEDAGPRPWTWLSYAVLHGSWAHVALNAVWLAAFGTPLVRRAGLERWLLLALAAALAGALAQWLADPLSAQPVIGASAIVSGFMAAAATFAFASPRGAPAWSAEPPSRRADWSFLRNRTALAFLGVWLLLNLLFGLVAVPLGLAEGAGIAWQAHMGGFVVGLLFPLLDPGPRFEPPRHLRA